MGTRYRKYMDNLCRTEAFQESRWQFIVMAAKEKAAQHVCLISGKDSPIESYQALAQGIDDQGKSPWRRKDTYRRTGLGVGFEEDVPFPITVPGIVKTFVAVIAYGPYSRRHGQTCRRDVLFAARQRHVQVSRGLVQNGSTGSAIGQAVQGKDIAGQGPFVRTVGVLLLYNRSFYVPGFAGQVHR